MSSTDSSVAEASATSSEASTPVVAVNKSLCQCLLTQSRPKGYQHVEEDKTIAKKRFYKCFYLQRKTEELYDSIARMGGAGEKNKNQASKLKSIIDS